jgi:hypothetical protein
MPVLLGWLSSALGAMIGWFASFLTKRAANYAALAVATAAAYGVMWAALTAITNTLVGTMPDVLVAPFTWFVPTNFRSVVSAYISAQVTIAAYRWHKRVTTASAAAA